MIKQESSLTEAMILELLFDAVQMKHKNDYGKKTSEFLKSFMIIGGGMSFKYQGR